MPHQKEYNVIIIGAGVAGLSAAQHLAAIGRTVLVIEAKQRVGGRIHTLDLQSDCPIEMGADFLQQPGTHEKPNPLAPLLHHLNLTTSPVESITSQQFNIRDYAENASRIIQAAKQISCDAWPSLGEVLKDNPISDKTGKQIVRHMIQQHTGTTPNRVSLLELMQPESEFEGNISYISGGYQHLPIDMANQAIATGKVKVLLNTPIREIQYDLKNHKTTVWSVNNKKFSANSVLCTVPIGVLKKHSLQFTPKLSAEKQQLIKNIQIGFHNKIILEFEKVFWPKETHYLYPGSQDPHAWPEYFNLYPFLKNKRPILIANVYANDADFKERTDDQIIEHALLPLHTAYGKQFSNLKKAFVTHWDSDPYALGSTSCSGVNMTIGEMKHFERPEPGGLFFAGAHTLANRNRETVHGAYISGVRAALDIDYYLHEILKSKKRSRG